jgi:hypothetical protein
MNVVDSSAWLEYFADGTNVQHFAAPIEKPEDLLVPSITLYEFSSAWPSSATRGPHSNAWR